MGQKNTPITSEVYAGRVSASQVITPELVADLITAKTIKADHIEGLDILTNKISQLDATLYAATQSAVLGDSIATDSAEVNPGMLTLDSLNVAGIATVSADLRVKGNGLVEGVFNVIDTITSQNLIPTKVADFFGQVIFHGDVSFRGRPTFNSDTAGFAVVSKGETEINIEFSQEYTDMPVVTVGITLDKVGDEVLQQQLEDEVLNGNLTYVITQRTTKGFVIKLNRPAPDDINFSWIAISVDNVKTSVAVPSAASVPATSSADLTQ
jgi:hypothetical protein